jgi:hypothetical protein
MKPRATSMLNLNSSKQIMDRNSMPDRYGDVTASNAAPSQTEDNGVTSVGRT